MTLSFAFITSTLLISTATAQKFDPYQLNGGLVAAVAGKDYVLIASDTRLTDGGYGINSRRYLSGRIWSASSSSTSSSDFSSSNTPNDSPSVTSTSPSSTSTTQQQLTLRRFPAEWEPDGSLVMPSIHILDSGVQTRKMAQIESGPDTIPTSPSHFPNRLPQTNNMPIMIGSAGCASDCESLKRRVRLELDALEYSFPTGSSSLGVQSVANLLQ
mmetsp:Transcript_25078/g.45164  ORF Transcript_25078/g.45164 Transcript_25078/m.45164 type:complete len:214 (-) Transcript_25078:559-1200(-)